MGPGNRAKLFCVVALFAGCINASDLGGGSGAGDSGIDATNGVDAASSGDASSTDAASNDGGIDSIADLAIYFPFDEGTGTTVTDRGPGAYVGNLKGSAAFITGHSGTAVSFAGDGGSAGEVVVPDEPGLSIGSPATISFWINLDDLPATDERLVEMGYSWEIKLNGSGETPQLTWNGADGGGGTIEPVNGLSKDAWHHLAFTFDSTVGPTVYVDGRLQDNGTFVFTPGQFFRLDTYGLTIGSATGGTSTCKCRIDELRLYKRTLTADEIKMLAQ